MCEKAVEVCSWQLKYVLDRFKTKTMCKKAVEDGPETLEYVLDHFKTQDMCYQVARPYISSLKYVPDRFVTQQQIKLWYDEDYVYKRPEIIEWYNCYQKRKAQKASIKKELLPIAWHPSKYWDWCVPEDEKKETEQLWK